MTGEEYYQKYLEDFENLSNKEIIYIFNNEVGKKGWGTARASYLGAIHSQFNSRGIDYSEIGDKKSISFTQKVKLKSQILLKLKIKN